MNTVSPYYSDEELCSQLRMQYSLDEMWNIDFQSLLSQIIDMGDYLRLQIKGRTFNIDKITANVTEVEI